MCSEKVLPMCPVGHRGLRPPQCLTIIFDCPEQRLRRTGGFAPTLFPVALCSDIDVEKHGEIRLTETRDHQDLSSASIGLAASLTPETSIPAQLPGTAAPGAVGREGH
jgi:hypothetical protein